MNTSIFYDQRKSLLMLYIWMILVIIIFYSMGVMSSDFIHFGPNSTTKFMSITIDNWFKWSFLSFYILVNTLINSFVAENMGPWITNTVQDHKNLYIPYSKKMCILVVQTYYFYGNIMSMFGLFAMFSQFDFLLIRTFADCFICFFTTRKFLENKQHDPENYEKWFNRTEPEDMKEYININDSKV